MKRSTLLFALLCAVAFAGTARVRGQDTVHFVDRKTGKDDTKKGIIQSESPAGITIKADNKTMSIPALDVKSVDYKLGELKGFQYKVPFTKEKEGLDPKAPQGTRVAALTEAASEFDKLAKQMKDNPLAVRYLAYKTAQMRVLLAKEDLTQRNAAIAALNGYRQEHSTGWEIVPALKQLAQLQEEKGDVAGAKDTYKQLRIIPEMPKELVLESNILIANLLMRGKNYDEAEKTLREASQQLSDDDPQKGAILVHLCEAQMKQNKTQNVEKQLQAAINGSGEASMRALAHNTLGDYYRQQNQEEDAFWQYLRVDVLYPQDLEEHARALYWLSKLYDSVKKDKGKAQECGEKLKAKDFEAAEYARRFAAEK